MYAFVINHFGDNIKYLINEIYFLYMLRDNTINDIIYLYSINDTPKEYIDIINSLKLNIKTIPYNDNNVTYNVQFHSSYSEFNLLRTCNYIYAYQLIEYEKICIVESDMIITSNIDNIFELNTPSIVYYRLSNNDINKNIKININNKDIEYILKECYKESFTNGGVILFKPSLNNFEKLKKNIKKMIDINCIYPNETLFLYTFKKIYNLPIMYNMSHFFVTKYNIKEDIKILHYNNTRFKPVYIIEDESFNILKMKNPIKRNILLYFKKKYYKKYKKVVDKIII
jgi:alpha-N-acetylglucosamine transferase